MAIYHIAAMNHWREVVSEQTRILAEAEFDGLIQISFIGAPYEERFVQWIMQRYGLRHTIACSTDDLHQYEFPALRLLQEICLQGFDGTLMYFHTKGVSHPGHWPTLMWRWLMNGWVLKHWRQLQQALQDGTHNVAGTAWVHMFPTGAFAGTFWHAQADYICSLTPIDAYLEQFAACLRSSNPHSFSHRHAAEFWINSRCTARPAVFGPGDSRLWDHHWWTENSAVCEFCLEHGS